METSSSQNSQRKPSIISALLVAFALLVVFYLLTKWLMVSTAKVADEEVVRGKERVEILQKVQAAQKQKLEGYAWVDEKKGLVQIPIERAMELAIAALNAKRPERAAYPVNATPMPVPATSPPSSSAPAASPTSTKSAKTELSILVTNHLEA